MSMDNTSLDAALELVTDLLEMGGRQDKIIANLLKRNDELNTELATAKRTINDLKIKIAVLQSPSTEVVH